MIWALNLNFKGQQRSQGLIPKVNWLEILDEVGFGQTLSYRIKNIWGWNILQIRRFSHIFLRRKFLLLNSSYFRIFTFSMKALLGHAQICLQLQYMFICFRLFFIHVEKVPRHNLIDKILLQWFFTSLFCCQTSAPVFEVLQTSILIINHFLGFIGPMR